MITRTSLENQSENKSLDINVLDFTIHIYTMLFFVNYFVQTFQLELRLKMVLFFSCTVIILYIFRGKIPKGECARFDSDV